jgi:hypothetical protein
MSAEPKSFHILISDYQRRLLITMSAVILADPTLKAKFETMEGQWEDNGAREVQSFKGLLEGLYDDEIRMPGIIHMFTL